ncbi:MAG TPA: crossover junction endodeoxyribonuclease RuvC, partial [Actinomycetota bacterium]|nr:crossover junction endodeoxyribonuclease RuvC [Actinomycetota bacterium]
MGVDRLNYTRVILDAVDTRAETEHMFERVVMGVDPGTAATGVAVVAAKGSRRVVLSATTVRTPAGAPESDRLYALHRAVRRTLAESHPDAVAIERLLWGKNVASAMAVSRASGVVLVAAAEAGLPVREYAPPEVKMAVTGSGTAGKDDVRRALARLHAIADVPREPDAADAVAVAVCDLQQY